MKLYLIIVLFIIMLLLNVSIYPQDKSETMITKNGTEYKYIINGEQTQKAETFYKILLKNENPKYRLNKIPLIVSDLEDPNISSPFFAMSYTQDKTSTLKIVLFKNVIERFFKNNILDILQNKFQNEDKKKLNITPEYFYLKILLHHLSHFSGPSAIQMSTKETVFIDTLLLNNFKTIEEIRADMSSLSILKQLIIKEKLTEKEKKDIFKLHIAHLLYLNKHSKDKTSCSIQLNFFKKAGALTYNMITNEISIDWLELDTSIKELLKITKNFEKKAETSETTISKFIEKFSTISDNGEKK